MSSGEREFLPVDDTWMVVRESRDLGGYRVVRYGLSEAMARSIAAEYKRPHEAMRAKDLMEIRKKAIEGGR